MQIGGKKGSGIYTSNFATVTSSVFKNFKNMTFSIIQGTGKSTLEIENCSFLDSWAMHATAIYTKGSISVKQSIFKNLHSTKSAGAIGIKDVENVTIDSCIFENTSSVKNGGAIYIDCGDNVLISNNRFINTSGNFGGAILILEGNLIIVNNTFEECSCIYDGGAIFISQSKKCNHKIKQL